jgi:predicted TIM-barrel fold metal-dependent hydrolase
LSHIIFTGVFERYPKLQIGSVEQELGWAPHFIERMDYNFVQRPATGGRRKFKEDMLPSDYFRRNVFLSFQEDALGIRDRDLIGVDNILWGSDYPHPECTFPHSRQVLETVLADCSEEEKAKIVGGNTARIYHFD